MFWINRCVHRHCYRTPSLIVLLSKEEMWLILQSRWYFESDRSWGMKQVPVVSVELQLLSFIVFVFTSKMHLHCWWLVVPSFHQNWFPASSPPPLFAASYHSLVWSIIGTLDKCILIGMNESYKYINVGRVDCPLLVVRRHSWNAWYSTARSAVERKSWKTAWFDSGIASSNLHGIYIFRNAVSPPIQRRHVREFVRIRRWNKSLL